MLDLLIGSLYAVIAGTRGWTDIHEYVLGHHNGLILQHSFKNDIPVDVTFAGLIVALFGSVF
jgi:hypothetical protein